MTMVSPDFSAQVPVTMVAAVTRDGGLGRSGQLLYRISADMKHFKALTMGHPLIMGRKTYESFPGGPLPGRLNIVLTRQDIALPEGAAVAHTPQEALDIAASYIAGRQQDVAGDEDATRGGICGSVMVIGGGEIYKMFMPLASRLELTEIDAPAPADTDTWFPEVDPARWSEEAGSILQADPRSGVSFRFISLRNRLLRDIL